MGLGSFLVLAVLMASLMVAIAGEKLFSIIPIVRKYNLVKENLGSVLISGRRLAMPVQLAMLPMKNIENLRSADCRNTSYDMRRLGDAIEIVYVRSHRHKKTVRELQLCCYILLLLFAFAVGWTEYNHNFSLRSSELMEEITAKPIEFFAVLEILTIIIFMFRLIMDVWDLNRLLEGE